MGAIMSAQHGQIMRRETALRSFERWKTIQLASILPLLLCTVWIFYFRIATECAIMMCFYVLAVGVLIPEVKADLTETHFVIREELSDQHMELRQLLGEEVEHFLEDPAARDLLSENSVFPKVGNWS